MAFFRISDFDVKKTAQFIVEQHKRFLAGAADSGLDAESIRLQANAAFQQLTGISLVFVSNVSINEYVSDCQRQVWDITNEYFGFYGRTEV